jgi:hypothetical protein
VRGHHIYTRSWFEYGSKSSNAGTFTVELTNGIFGGDAERTISESLKPMFDAVPEALAPRNTGKSLLRIFHLSPETTILSRSWYVTDEITERGIVPYSYSLILTEKDNEAFLGQPDKTFLSVSFEAYKDFAARAKANPNTPTVPSSEYDLQMQDVIAALPIDEGLWVHTLGFSQDLFIRYFASLCKTICGKANARIGVILPADINSEDFILATMVLLPLFMRKKFGAASHWTGMMDGSGTRVIQGIQLLCYFEEMPISEQELTIIDLTGAGRHKYTEDKLTHYAAWVWENLNHMDNLSIFDAFLNKHFGRVLSRMPFDVVENCFELWFYNSQDNISLPIAQYIIKIISESFAKSFATYPFVHDRLIKSLVSLHSVINAARRGEPTEEIKTLTVDTIQAICQFASNGEEKARNLAFAMNEYFCASGDWGKAEVTASYLAWLLLQPNISPDIEKDCVEAFFANINCKDEKCKKIFSDALTRFCMRNRQVMLADTELSDKAFANYSDASFALYGANDDKLPPSFFQLPERQGHERISSQRFFQLEELNLTCLDLVPNISRWRTAHSLSADLPEDKKCELYEMYYKRLEGNKRGLILALEDSGCLQILVRSGGNTANEIKGFFVDRFKELWNPAERRFAADKTWVDIGDWLNRFQNLGWRWDADYIDEIRKTVNFDCYSALPELTDKLLPDSIEVIRKLYGDNSLITGIRDIDKAGINEQEFFPIIQRFNDDTPLERSAFLKRMKYWYDRQANPKMEWAMALTLAKSPGRFQWEEFLELRRYKRVNASANPSVDDAVDVFTAISEAKHFSSRQTNILDSVNDAIDNLFSSGFGVQVFSDENAIRAFERISESGYWKRGKGEYIASKLSDIDKDKAIGSEILDRYCPPIRRYAVNTLESHGSSPPIGVLMLISLDLIITILSSIFLLHFGKDLAGAILGFTFAFWLPCILSAFLFISIVASLVLLFHRTGGKSS